MIRRQGVLILEDEPAPLLALLQDLYDHGLCAVAPPRGRAIQMSEIEALLPRLQEAEIPFWVARQLDQVSPLMVNSRPVLAVLDMTIREPSGAEKKLGGLEAANEILRIDPSCQIFGYTGAEGDAVLRGLPKGVFQTVFTKGAVGVDGRTPVVTERILRELGRIAISSATDWDISKTLLPIWKQAAESQTQLGALADGALVPPPVRTLARRPLSTAPRDLEERRGFLCRVTDTWLWTAWETRPALAAVRLRALPELAQLMVDLGDDQDRISLAREIVTILHRMPTPLAGSQAGVELRDWMERMKESPKSVAERLRQWCDHAPPPAGAGEQPSVPHSDPPEPALPPVELHVVQIPKPEAEPTAPAPRVSDLIGRKEEPDEIALEEEPAGDLVEPKRTLPVVLRPADRAAAEEALALHAREGRNDPWNALVLAAGAWNAGELLLDPEEFAQEQVAGQIHELARYKLERKARTPAPRDPLSQYLARRTIWLIDDHAAVWQPLLAALFGPDTNLVIFETVDDAVRQAAYPPDLILQDLYVPLMRLYPCTYMGDWLSDRGISPQHGSQYAPSAENGELGLQVLRSLIPLVPVLVFTRSREVRRSRDCMSDAGAAGYCFKNVDTGSSLPYPQAAQALFEDFRRSLLQAVRRGLGWRLGLESRRAASLTLRAADIADWLSQFEPEDRAAVLEMLGSWKVIDDHRLSELCARALAPYFGDPAWLAGQHPENVVIIGASRPGKSGPALFYPIWHLEAFVNCRGEVPLVTLDQVDALLRKQPHLVREGRFLLVDDFVGTGRTIFRAVERLQKLLIRAGADKAAIQERLGVAIAAAVPRALDRVKVQVHRTSAGDEEIPTLDGALRVAVTDAHMRVVRNRRRIVRGRADMLSFSEVRLRPTQGQPQLGDILYLRSGDISLAKMRVHQASTLGLRASLLPGNDPITLESAAGLQFTIDTGLTVDWPAYEPLGYEETGALVSYAYNTPNNAPPMLWGSANRWRPLFPRKL